RPWQSINHCEFANDRAGTEDREDALSALVRRDADFEDTFREPIAAVGWVATLEECLSLCKVYRRRVCQQPRGVFSRESRQQVMRTERGSSTRHISPRKST